MASITKLPNPANAPPQSSYWNIQLSAAELTALQAGGACSLTVTLPISDPNAYITFTKGGE